MRIAKMLFRSLPHVWCPNGKTPFDFTPELRGLFYKPLNRRTLNEMLAMKSRCRHIPDMERFREELMECIAYCHSEMRKNVKR